MVAMKADSVWFSEGTFATSSGTKQDLGEKDLFAFDSPMGTVRSAKCTLRGRLLRPRSTRGGI
jgi:hypothetical protein